MSYVDREMGYFTGNELKVSANLSKRRVILTGRWVEMSYFDREMGHFTARCVIEMGHFDREMGGLL